MNAARLDRRKIDELDLVSLLDIVFFFSSVGVTAVAFLMACVLFDLQHVVCCLILLLVDNSSTYRVVQKHEDSKKILLKNHRFTYKR